MKTRHWLMLSGFIVAAWLAFFGDKSAETGVAEPVARRSPPPQAMTAAGRSSAPVDAPSRSAGVRSARDEGGAHILALLPRSGPAGSGQAEGGLFSGTTWTPPPPPKSANSAPPPPPAPVAPPLPFVYLGKQVSDGKIEVFLARGDEVLVVRDRSVIQNIYRVESIGPKTLSLVYLPLGQVQQLSIGVIN